MGKRDVGVWVGLVIRCFRLDLAHEDVAGGDELVLVEGVVFDCCAVAMFLDVSTTLFLKRRKESKEANRSADSQPYRALETSNE